MNSKSSVDQLALVVVSGRQADELMRQLVQARFYFTKIDSSGQLLQESTVCLLIGFSSNQLERLMGVIRVACHLRQEYVPTQLTMTNSLPPLTMIEAQVGGALVYVMDVEQFIQL